MKKIFVLSDFGPDVGLGHYKRSRILKDEIKKYFNYVNVKNFYFGSDRSLKEKLVSKKKFKKFLEKKINRSRPDCIILNISRSFENMIIEEIIILKKTFPSIQINSIDGNPYNSKIYNLLWIPNIYLEKKHQKKRNIIYGWDKILIEKKSKKKIIKDKKMLLVSIGGTDKFDLTKRLPNILNDEEFVDFKFLWVKGPFVKKPFLKKSVINFKFIENRLSLNKLYMKSSFAIVLFGVSFFETVYYGIPQIVHFPKEKKEIKGLIKKLRKRNFLVSQNLIELKKNLKILFKNEKKFKKMAKKNIRMINFKERKKILKKFIGIH